MALICLLFLRKVLKCKTISGFWTGDTRQIGPMVLGRLAADLGIAAGTEASGQVPADGGMVAVDPDQRQQSRRHVDLAANSGHAPGFNRSAENDTWNVKAIW